MKLILLGPPGSGKGTIAKQLVQDFDLKHIAPGDIFRDEVKRETEMGKKVKEIIESGQYVPDEITIQLVKARLDGDVVLDGFPRTLAQAESIKDVEIDHVLNFVVPLDVVIERLGGRRIDAETGEIYHVKTMPPPPGRKLIQRKDDEPEAIKKRFEVYNEKTSPLVNYYKEKGLLVDVDASGSPEEEYANVLKAIGRESP